MAIETSSDEIAVVHEGFIRIQLLDESDEPVIRHDGTIDDDVVIFQMHREALIEIVGGDVGSLAFQEFFPSFPDGEDPCAQFSYWPGVAEREHLFPGFVIKENDVSHGLYEAIKK